ncbi:uncharacterized protein LOC134179512 [Corticium candelabrum]|uniref:uncharacterized protein LOC134179512 n=1 Tax=Corticium candelabrum TaxID=121492 RepID=UPI002E2574EA|nr:uncharacterized protein LOC134179512 [Corticium candelabrum]
MFDELAEFKDCVCWHSCYDHQEDASRVSSRLSLGLIRCNENFRQGMMEIVRYVNEQYVPYVDKKHVLRVQFTGDQKTAERIQSTVTSALHEETEYDRMAGLFTHSEDFHCSVAFVDLIPKFLRWALFFQH